MNFLSIAMYADIGRLWIIVRPSICHIQKSPNTVFNFMISGKPPKVKVKPDIIYCMIYFRFSPFYVLFTLLCERKTEIATAHVQ